jgi:hypothetical protein
MEVTLKLRVIVKIPMQLKTMLKIWETREKKAYNHMKIFDFG